jgi:hypothetical protein
VTCDVVLPMRSATRVGAGQSAPDADATRKLLARPIAPSRSSAVAPSPGLALAYAAPSVPRDQPCWASGTSQNASPRVADDRPLPDHGT